MIYKVYFADSGVAKTGLSPTFDTYKKVSDGSDVTKPTFTEIGGGWYKFTATPSEDIVGVVNSNDGAMADADRYVPVDVTADDGGLVDILDAVLGDKVLNYTTDTLTLTRRDGVTTLKIFDMTENAADAKSYTESAGQ